MGCSIGTRGSGLFTLNDNCVWAPGGLDVTVKHGAWEILIGSGVFEEVGLSSGGCRSGS